MYCLKCEHLFEGEKCPYCGSKKVRQAEDDDLCFLTDQPYGFAQMLEDVFKQNDVRFLKRGNLGAAMSAYLSPALETYRFYVTYRDYAAAKDLVDELFSLVPEDPAAFDDTEAEDERAEKPYQA